jgi:SNF2 family DNA or RNA helicase
MEPDEWKALMSQGDNWRSSHLDTVVEIAKEHFRDPDCGDLIIFCEFLAPLDLVEIDLKKTLGKSCLRHDGTANGEEKAEQLRWVEDQFKDDMKAQFTRSIRPEGPLILLMTSRGGGEGLNLPQGNRVIILCPSFNPCVDLQAWHRVLRRGQTRPCYLHILFPDLIYEKCNAYSYCSLSS